MRRQSPYPGHLVGMFRFNFCFHFFLIEVWLIYSAGFISWFGSYCLNLVVFCSMATAILGLWSHFLSEEVWSDTRAHTQELQQLRWQTRHTELIQSPPLLSRRHLSWFQGRYDRVGWDLCAGLWGHLADFLNRQVRTPGGRKVLCQLEALSLEEKAQWFWISLQLSASVGLWCSPTSAWAGIGFPDLKDCSSTVPTTGHPF